jgi:hypothetical protein
MMCDKILSKLLVALYHNCVFSLKKVYKAETCH